MQLTTELYIATSRESKELYQKSLPKAGFFNCEALTLSDIFALINHDTKILDTISARVYFKEAVKSLLGNFEHFKFTENNLYEDSVDLMYEFYGKIKLNDLDLGEFVAGDKKSDVEMIFTKYEALKIKLGLFDSSDLILNITPEQIDYFLKSYDSVVIDSLFYDDGISFLTSKKVQELFQSIKTTQKEEVNAVQSTSKITLNKAFDFVAETREAVKIACGLLEGISDIKASDIAIVVSKLDDYKHNLEVALDEYNLKGYITAGKDFDKSPLFFEMKKLKNKNEFEEYAKDAEEKVLTLPKDLQREYASGVNLGLQLAKKAFKISSSLKLENYKVGFEDIYTQLAMKSSIEAEDRKDAILVTEHNQILKTKYKHIIYLGIDSTHLPQRFSDNFLYSSKDSEKLYISNYYKDAVYVYKKLKQNCENLHLIHAEYQNKRELQISSVISDSFIQELKSFDTSKIESLNDLLNKGNQTDINEDAQEFIKSKQLKSPNVYNGVLDIQSEEVKSIKFSASRLNEYSICPMKYYFNYTLASKSPQDFNDDTLDSAEAGTLFHAVVEEFAKKYKGKYSSINIDEEVQKIYNSEYNKALPIKNEKVYETVLHKQKKIELQVAIDRFKQYVKAGKLNNFKEAERKFDFEMDGNSFIGFIDRIDIDEEKNEITLIDYKTSKSEKNTGKNDSKYQKLTEYKEFQLPLYHFFVDQDKKYKEYEKSESYLLTFAGDIKKDTCARFGQTSSTSSNPKEKIFLLDEVAKAKYRDEIGKIAKQINKGSFFFSSSEESCQWCNYLTICGNGVRVEKKF